MQIRTDLKYKHDGKRLIWVQPELVGRALPRTENAFTIANGMKIMEIQSKQCRATSILLRALQKVDDGLSAWAI